VQPIGHCHDPAARDGAIERVRRLTRWLVAAAIVGTGSLIGVVAHDFPGHHPASSSLPPSTGTGSAGGGVSGASSGSSGSSGSSSSSGLGQPANPPVAAPPTTTPHVHAATGAS